MSRMQDTLRHVDHIGRQIQVKDRVLILRDDEPMRTQFDPTGKIGSVTTVSQNERGALCYVLVDDHNLGRWVLADDVVIIPLPSAGYGTQGFELPPATEEGRPAPERPPATAELIAAARAHYQDDDGDVEIDDDAVTSRSDDGTWVQAWVYVSDEMLAEHNNEAETE